MLQPFKICVTSSLGPEAFPPSHFFVLWIRKEWLDAKSKEFGCRSISWNFAIVMTQVCTRIISWLEIISFFAEYRRFSSSSLLKIVQLICIILSISYFSLFKLFDKIYGAYIPKDFSHHFVNWQSNLSVLSGVLWCS